MTSIDPPPASADVAALPADPTVYRRRGVGAGVWLILILCVLCIGGGVAGGLYVAKRWPKAVTAVPAPTTPLPWRASTAEPIEAPVAAIAPEPAEPAAPGRAGGDVAGLSERVAHIEQNEQRLTRAASAALATSALVQASQTSRPFAAELAAVDSLLPEAADVAALRRVAQTGAPTRTGLAAEFPAAASRAIAAAHTPSKDSGLIQRIQHAVGSIVTVRRVDYVKGDGPHAVLARAESRLDEGDVEGALAELDALPAGAREALAGWRVRAERRAEVDRRVANIRETSMRSLRDAMEAGA